MEGKKQQVVRYLLAIYALFGVLLAYTLFANTGIGFRVDKETLPVQLFVENNSQHEIRNIQIFEQESSIPFTTIESLKPGEEKKLDSSAFSGKIVLTAKAPYHLDLQTEVELSSQVNVKVSLTAPDSMTVGRTDSATVELCNQGGASADASVQFTNNPLVSANPPQQSKTVPPQQCADFEFVLQGLQIGNGTIEFNISADQIHKLISKNVQVH